MKTTTKTMIIMVPLLAAVCGPAKIIKNNLVSSDSSPILANPSDTTKLSLSTKTSGKIQELVPIPVNVDGGAKKDVPPPSLDIPIPGVDNPTTGVADVDLYVDLHLDLDANQDPDDKSWNIKIVSTKTPYDKPESNDKIPYYREDLDVHYDQPGPSAKIKIATDNVNGVIQAIVYGWAKTSPTDSFAKLYQNRHEYRLNRITAELLRTVGKTFDTTSLTKEVLASKAKLEESWTNFQKGSKEEKEKITSNSTEMEKIIASELNSVCTEIAYRYRNELTKATISNVDDDVLKSIFLSYGPKKHDFLPDSMKGDSYNDSITTSIRELLKFFLNTSINPNTTTGLSEKHIPIIRGVAARKRSHNLILNQMVGIAQDLVDAGETTVVTGSIYEARLIHAVICHLERVQFTLTKESMDMFYVPYFKYINDHAVGYGAKNYPRQKTEFSDLNELDLLLKKISVIK